MNKIKRGHKTFLGEIALSVNKIEIELKKSSNIIGNKRKKQTFVTGRRKNGTYLFYPRTF
jgi:hypothetical protein